MGFKRYSGHPSASAGMASVTQECFNDGKMPHSDRVTQVTVMQKLTHARTTSSSLLKNILKDTKPSTTSRLSSGARRWGGTVLLLGRYREGGSVFVEGNKMLF